MSATESQTTTSPAKTAAPATEPARRDNLLVHLLLGMLFGIILVKTEVLSWFRIQEMFRLQSFHMYGTIGGAVVVAAISIWAIRRFDIRSIYGERVAIKPKTPTRGYNVVWGGIIFGLGWALLGACPGPIYALIGSGLTVMVVALIAAIGGAWAYGYLKPRLPH